MTPLRCSWRNQVLSHPFSLLLLTRKISSYGTEAAVGKGIKKSGVPRESIFLTTKLWNTKHNPDDVEKALDTSLRDLGTDYVDLLLIHWPVAFARGDEPFPKDGNGMRHSFPASSHVLSQYLGS